MDDSSLVCHHQDGELSDSIKIGHRVPESARHVGVAVSVEVLRHALVTEDLHVGSSESLLVEIHLQGAFLLAYFHLDVRVCPPESGDLSRQAVFDFGDLDSCVLEVGVVRSLDGLFQ